MTDNVLPHLPFVPLSSPFTSQYACTFGVELQLDNMAANYFYTRFKVDQSMAAIAASSFGLCNIFARAMGGIASDMVGKRSVGVIGCHLHSHPLTLSPPRHPLPSLPLTLSPSHPHP